jgi:ankyrin repeat protein
VPCNYIVLPLICSAVVTGACLQRQDREGLTALGWACLRGRVQAAQCLLDRGANVNHADKTGRTPLDLAAFQGNPILVQVRE